MKNFILSLLTFGAFSSVFAQSIEVTTDSPIPAMSIVDLTTTKDFLGFHVKNVSAQSVDVRINRIVNNIPLEHETYFCWEYCYDPETNISGGAQANGIAIAPDSTIDNFTFHINANGFEGCGQVVIRFFNKKDASDYVEKVISYCTPNAVGIVNEINASQVLSAPMPNPSADLAIVKIALPRPTENTYVAISDLTGKEISRFEVNQPNSNISIPTSQYNTGLYYVSLVAEGAILASQKMVVSH